MNHVTKITLKFSVNAIVLAAFIVGFIGCKDDPINLGHVAVNSSSTLGDILVDGKGKTLYVFTKDVAGQSACTGGCLTSWSVFYASDIKPAGTGVNVTDFATITRADGAMQTTFKGWPLYHFADDVKTGDVKGDGSEGVWFAATPNYSLMLGNAQLVGGDGKNYTTAYVEGTGESQYLVDINGRTLYTFKNDFINKNNFTKSDFSNDAAWPIFYTDVDSLPSKLHKADFGEIDVFGRSQLTYKGHPLYYYGQDAKRGDTKGVSVGSVPGAWPIVNTETVFSTVLTTNNSTFGNILLDDHGHTLYFFAKDTKGTNSCNCPAHWPVFNAGTVVLPAGSPLSLADFGTIGDGATKQTTYKGWPLYLYAPANDGVLEAVGSTSGDNVGTVWFVAKPDYSIMVASAQLMDGSVPPVNYTDIANNYAAGNGSTKYFVDAWGRTLYLYVPDTKNTNTFSTADAGHNSSWPIFSVGNVVGKFPTGILPADFAIVNFALTSTAQLVYKGHPLYYFVGDGTTRNGSNRGFAAGGIATKWRIVNTDVVVLE